MRTLSLAWLLGKPTAARRAPMLLTAGAYGLVSALVLTTIAGALSFNRIQNELSGMYLMLAGLACVLLIVPLAVLGSAAARLSARSQDLRLSTVRLLGGTPGLVLGITVVESALVAFTGAMAGIALYAGMAPLVGMIQFQGSAIGAAIWLNPGIIALVVLGVVLIAALSSGFGMRKIIVSPLGVRNRSQTPKPRWIRALIVVGLIAGISQAFSMISVFKDLAVMLAVLLGGFALGVGALNLVGPWAVGLIGKAKLKKAETPEKLLAARMILENPAQAWRQVSGIAMTCFVAVVGGSGAALMNMAGTESSPGSPDALLSADVMTGVIITIVVSFISVACSTAITQAATTLDRAELYAGLNMLGVQRSTMEKARVGSVMGPVIGVGLGSIIISGVLVLPLAGMAMIFAPLSVAIILGTLVAGVLAVRGAVALTSTSQTLKLVRID
ncbi:permease [Arthrobacter sp. MYb227]|uniref:permease n=1 Tax=Arthrobacter sp. MYb227 TaxID=1848601 RepID=UPI000CFE0500|nr:permease [Arthrobacter sp. MYb227]PQZ86436.1 permease [Arthrobacter sp. MYb227]